MFMSCTRRNASSCLTKSLALVTLGLGLPLLCSWTVAAQVQPADTVLKNGYVYTVDKTRLVAEAVAIKDGRIVYVGEDRDARHYMADHTRVVDLEGRMVIPGIHEGHIHVEFLGRSLSCSMNYEALTMAEVRKRILGCLEQSRGDPADRLLRVYNWGPLLPSGAPYSKADLDLIPTERPIILTKSYYHLSLVNSRALELAGITAETPDPPGGKIQRDTQGEPTGILIDTAAKLLDGLDTPPTLEENIRSARAATEALISQGATSFMEALASESLLKAMKALHDQGELPVRANFAIRIGETEAHDPEAALARLRELRERYSESVLSPTPGLHIGTAKILVDGDFTYPSHSAAMLEPYWVNAGTDENPDWKPGPNRGPDPLYFPAPDLLNPLVAALDQNGWQIHVHANGDRATRRTLDAFEAAIRANRTASPLFTRRHTITHLFLVEPADWSRFGDLGVIASMAFQWHKRDFWNIHRVEKYMGPERFRRIYPARGLLNGGALLAYGGDCPVDPLDYWFALEVAVTRTGEERGEYEGSLNADEYAITLEQAIEAFTINGAYQLFQEHVTGSLEVGKFADLIVLDRNLFEIPITEISETKVLMTVVGGKVVYSDDSHP